MKRYLITAALPYVNNEPHLGNIIGSVLSADVYARWCRLQGRETLFVSGTDEYGTAIEIRARKDGVSCHEICNTFHRLHAEVYSWLNISFDIFGRTTTETHLPQTQSIYRDLVYRGYITENETDLFFDTVENVGLSDRFIKGTCPHCRSPEAYGDQCDACGRLLKAEDLQDPVRLR